MRYKDLDGEFLKEIKTVLKQNKLMRFDSVENAVRMQCLNVLNVVPC